MTRFSVRHPFPIVMAVLAILLMGGVAYTYLKVDRLPPLSYPTVSVTTRYPQASALDVEQLVTQIIEDAVAGVEGIESISSTSREGRSSVRLQLMEGADPDMASLEVERRIARIRSRLPADALDPTVAKADPNEFPIINIAITGAPLDELYDVATTQIGPSIESVLGVAAVTVSGGLQREWQVRVNYSTLAGYNLSVQQLSNALVAANVTSTIGSVDQGLQQLDVRAVGAFQTREDLERIVIAQQPAGPVLLKDVATVVDGYKDRLQMQRRNGRDAVGLSVVKASNANALKVAEDVQKTMKRLETTLPAGATYVITNDSSKYTRAALEAVEKDLMLAVFLVALVVLVFLHAWRNVVIIILSIPTSIVATFLVMYAMGMSLNLMTLMALALTVGILVDDSTVVLENIHRHLHRGEDPQDAAIRGRNEIGLAALAITAADVVVYLPIAFMSGFVGQLFRQYGMTVVVATLFSLLVSFTLTPMLAARWSKRPSERGIVAKLGGWWDAGFDQVAAAAQWAVPISIRVRWLVVVCGLLLFGSSVFLIQQRLVGSEYAPAEDSDQFSVTATTPPGTSLRGTDLVAQQVEAELQKMPEVQEVFTSISIGGAGFNSGTGGTARILVQLKPKSERQRSVFEIVQDMRQVGRRIPGARVVPFVPSSLPGGGGSSGLDFDVSGTDIDVLREVVRELETVASTVPGLVDIQNNSEQGSPTVEISFDAARMSQMGVTTQQAISALRTTVGGQVVTQLRRPGKVQQDITVIAEDVDRKDLAKLASIPIKGTVPTGNNTTAAVSSTALVTLGQVATIRPGTGPVQIQRLNRNRNITVTGTAVGRSLGDVATDLRAALASVELPAGYTVVPGRQVNRFNDAVTALCQATILALLLEYMLLAALYESWAYPLVLILSVPLGLVGSIWALYVTGNTINIFSLMGLIMAFGLVAKNGILLVDFTNQLRKQGMERTEALALSARTRLRPIMMTTATMAFGMLPLAMKLESGAESRAPMAVVVIGALLTSTALATLVLPPVYTLLDDLQILLGKIPLLWSARPALEPAPALVPGPSLVPGPVEYSPSPLVGEAGERGPQPVGG